MQDQFTGWGRSRSMWSRWGRCEPSTPLGPDERLECWAMDLEQLRRHLKLGLRWKHVYAHLAAYSWGFVYMSCFCFGMGFGAQGGCVGAEVKDVIFVFLFVLTGINAPNYLPSYLF